MAWQCITRVFFYTHTLPHTQILSKLKPAHVSTLPNVKYTGGVEEEEEEEVGAGATQVWFG